MEPVAEAGGYPLPAPPLRLDGERPPVRRPPPALDEHGDELRAWLSGRRLGGARAGRYSRGQLLPDDLRQHEAHVLAQDLELRHVLGAAGAEEVDEPLRRAPPGALAPEEMPTTRAPSSHSSRTSASLSIRCDAAPQSRATSTRRLEFDEFFEPMTSTRSHCSAICLTASWRFVVA